MATQSRSGRSRFEDFDRYTAATYAVYLLGLAFFIFPVLWAISMSVRPRQEVISVPLRVIPSEFTFEVYRNVLENSDILRWVWNSLKIALLEVAGILFLVTPAAYAFSRFRFKGKRAVLLAILLFQMISPVVIVIPLYNMMAQFGLLNTHIGLIALYIGLQVPFSVWLLKSYFDTIPEDLDKAARIDGCNRLQTLWHVLLPSVMPGIAVVSIFNFVFSWAEFVMAFTVLNDSKLFTIAMGVYSFQGQYSTDYRAIAAASVIAMIPLLVMFLALQRYFVSGLTDGAVKG
ncbi:carbohydrate ABC transporter permease [Halogeometricum luteum]|uniref:Carbohydrate ABC transporter permease n=1 Tax=Halogeometricum luteum TaxID=2950537 RepID=A0ABU2G3Q8_9EURY|nr:carbohydrate ABC transporter permease [Halogeometricum sp. S3BR5-2]MDS0295415.1 carbohydrate ABC transporter permease [Halogeometricum sp. S3BR5-2]